MDAAWNGPVHTQTNLFPVQRRLTRVASFCPHINLKSYLLVIIINYNTMLISLRREPGIWKQTKKKLNQFLNRTHSSVTNLYRFKLAREHTLRPRKRDLMECFCINHCNVVLRINIHFCSSGQHASLSFFPEPPSRQYLHNLLRCMSSLRHEYWSV